MVPPPDPSDSTPKRRSSPLRDAARECWALACWLTLRRTWADWELNRAGDDDRPRSQAALPPEVEQFFGSYAHSTYCRWIPAVSQETITRKDRDKKKRKAAKEDAANFDKLLDPDASADESRMEGATLRAREELAGVLAAEFGWDADSSSDDGDDAESDPEIRRGGSSQDPKLSFHSIHIEEPLRPHGPDDRTPWEAWVRTVGTLWEPTKRSRRVMMNELFKQPLSKPVGTPTEMLRCLTGYLKAIVRETVRQAAREAVRVASDESVTALDAPASRSDPRDSFTGMDVVASSENTAETVAHAELEARGARFAQEEFDHQEMSDGVRLANFLESLKSDEGSEGGFVVSIYEPAILSSLGTKKSTLGDRIQASRRRLMNRVYDDPESHTPQTKLVIGAMARAAMHQLATEWFWSERISRSLFQGVMDIIHTDDDPAFACPRLLTCQKPAAAAGADPACWDCPRKKP